MAVNPQRTGMTEQAALNSAVNRWAARFSPTAVALWVEAEEAYWDFCQPQIPLDEVGRRWKLVVHLAHNFKVQAPIREPMTEWRTIPPEVAKVHRGRNWPPRPEAASAQQQIVDAVGGDYCRISGLKTPTVSAIDALVHPASAAVVDRFAFRCVVAAAGGEHPLFGTSSALGERYPDDSPEAIPGALLWERDYKPYVAALIDMRQAAGIAHLRTVERALFEVGRLGAIKKEVPTWGELRDKVRGAFFNGSPAPSSE